MAGGGPIKELCDEATCSICLEYFKDPVILDCGHNFCQACLTQCWGEFDRGISCPQCRETAQPRNFRPNWQLANVVEIIKKLEEEGRVEDQAGLCERHQEPLKLFCKDDQTSICVVCDRSKEHKDHKVVPVEEHAQEYEEKAELKTLEKEREILVDQKVTEELRTRDFLTQLEMEKQKITSAFERMYDFLEDLELLRLAQLGGLKREIEEKHNGNLTRLSEEIAYLSNLITELGEKCQQPESDFLQDIRSTLSRYENRHVRPLMVFSPRLEGRLRIYSQTNATLEKTMEKYKVNFTLDPDTANPFLILSDDLKSVRRGSRYQDLPDNPERFDLMMSVLGCERFTSGRHWWEVEVEENLGRWAVGVVQESIRRKGLVRISPSEGFWAVGRSFRDTSSPCQVLAFTAPKPTPLNLRRKLRKIRVSLDYEEGHVEFFDVDSNDLIFCFPSASFSGERLLPFFRVWKGVRLKC
ncbi:zinc finger protein RFP-like [Tiliqua scincoides]|uniref:zinc finger protein RFP-like n=1 Tax=Tiliqua scincoides TaxID=71010 RepID=UPI003462F1A3